MQPIYFSSLQAAHSRMHLTDLLRRLNRAQALEVAAVRSELYLLEHADSNAFRHFLMRLIGVNIAFLLAGLQKGDRKSGGSSRNISS